MLNAPRRWLSSPAAPPSRWSRGLPFGVTIGQAFGWRNAIWMLAALAVAPALLVRILPPVHTPTTNLGDRLRTLADRTVLTILAGTVAALMTGFLVVAYVPVIVGISGTTVVVAMLSFGSGQVLGTTTVPALINRVGSRGTLTISAALATTAAICLLLRLGGEPLQILALFGIGLSLGTGMVPQQNRLFTLVPAKATVAMGLNGSAIYVSSAAGAAIGGAALGWGGEPTLTLSAVLVATLALTTAILLRPERVAPAAP
jgi:DHA1 family inner membrane transport protein